MCGEGFHQRDLFFGGRANFVPEDDETGALADNHTLEGYAEWMKSLLTPIPDGRYELKGFAANEDRSLVLGFAVFHGTQKGDGGPAPAAGNVIAADDLYAMEFAGGKISHMTKIRPKPVKATA